MKPTKRLGEARTPDGSLIELLSHDRDFFVRANGVDLMSTRRHFSEDRLAEVVCEPLASAPKVRALVGGLGLGFTLRAALKALAADAEVVVAELMPEVIAWNANPEWNISTEALRDPRTRVVQDDVFNVLRENVAGFDVIMLDTDNGPDAQLFTESTPLYELRGIGITMAALRPGGVIAYWSVGEDRAFEHALQRSGLKVVSEMVRAHPNTGPRHWLYIARPKVEPTR